MGMRRWTIVAVAVAVAAARPAAAQGQYRDQIERGREWLYKKLATSTEEAPVFSFGTLALLKTAPENARHETLVDPALRALIDRVRKEAERAETAGWAKTHHGHYGIPVIIMTLCGDDPDAHQSILRKLVDILVKAQLPNGGWSYPGDGQADTSVTQFVVLSLWDASLAGIEVPLEVWDRMLMFHIATQSAGGNGPGGFGYRPKVPEDEKPVQQQSTASMGVAGMSSMLIGRDQFPALRTKKKKAFSIGEYVRPVVDDDAKKVFQPRCTKERLDQAISAAVGFVGRVDGIKGEFVTAGRELYYCYGLERVSALRGKDAGASTLARLGPWVASQQKAPGNWDGAGGDIAETAMGVMFLGRATQRKLEKIEVSMLGRATAVGGTGIPTSQGGTALARQAERYRTTAVSNIADVVKIFENPEGLVPDEVAAQIETLTPKQMEDLVKGLGGNLRKLRRYAYDLRPPARKAALAALARTRDFRVAPILADALAAKEEDVYLAARDGLRYLARDPLAFELPAPDQRNGEGRLKAAQERVKAWIAGLKVELPAYQVYTPTDEG